MDTQQQTSNRYLLFMLYLGVAVPFLYFGTQLIASLFYPGYSFLSQSASQLGSDLAIYPWIFNVGTIFTGILTLIAAPGFFLALRRLNTHLLWSGLVALSVALNGIGSIWAGVFSLPDPRHGANPFTVGVFLFPILLLIALWKRQNARGIKTYLIINVLAFLIMIPIISGALGINIGGYGGLLQRISALIFFPPLGIGAYFLTQQIKSRP